MVSSTPEQSAVLSRIAHASFVSAQERAREAKLGIWNPATNTPKAVGEPAAKRPYDRLLPWWNLRAATQEHYKRRCAQDPDLVDVDDGEQVLEAARRCAADPELQLTFFTMAERFFDEDDGSLTVLLRGGDKQRLVRVVFPANARRPATEKWLRESTGEFRQNFILARGRLSKGPRGYRLDAFERDRWSAAEAP